MGFFQATLPHLLCASFLSYFLSPRNLHIVFKHFYIASFPNTGSAFENSPQLYSNLNRHNDRIIRTVELCALSVGNRDYAFPLMVWASYYYHIVIPTSIMSNEPTLSVHVWIDKRVYSLLVGPGYAYFLALAWLNELLKLQYFEWTESFWQISEVTILNVFYYFRELLLIPNRRATID